MNKYNSWGQPPQQTKNKEQETLAPSQDDFLKELTKTLEHINNTIHLQKRYIEIINSEDARLKIIEERIEQIYRQTIKEENVEE